MATPRTWFLQQLRLKHCLPILSKLSFAAVLLGSPIFLTAGSKPMPTPAPEAAALTPSPKPTHYARTQYVQKVKDQVGVKEIPKGSNRSKEIDAYNKAAGVPLGSPWCASMLHWCGLQIDKTLKGAWTPAWFPKSAIIPDRLIRAGDFYGVYNSRLGRIAHIGMVLRTDGNRVIGIEGNTNNDGSREGYMACVRSRLISPLTFSRWFRRLDSEGEGR